MPGTVSDSSSCQFRIAWQIPVFFILSPVGITSRFRFGLLQPINHNLSSQSHLMKLINIVVQMARRVTMLSKIIVNRSVTNTLNMFKSTIIIFVISISSNETHQHICSNCSKSNNVSKIIVDRTYNNPSL